MPLRYMVKNGNGFILWCKGSFYGVTDVDLKKIRSYIEIFAV